MANKAVLLNLGVFFASNNIRRNEGAFTHNFQSGSNPQIKMSKELAGSSSWTFTSAAPSNITIVEVSGQVSLDITLGVVPATPNKAARLSPIGVTQIVNQLAVIDDNVQQLIFTNPGIDPVLVTLVQG